MTAFFHQFARSALLVDAGADCPRAASVPNPSNRGSAQAAMRLVQCIAISYAALRFMVTTPAVPGARGFGNGVSVRKVSHSEQVGKVKPVIRSGPRWMQTAAARPAVHERES